MLPRLHAVTNDRILRLSDLAARAAAIGSAGHVGLHVRGRTAVESRLVETAHSFRRAGGTLFVNDRVDVAAHVHSTGIHLPAEGLPTTVVRDLLGPDVLIGRSSHDPDEALLAWDQGLDYVFLGPIWKTASHPGRPAIGTEAIEAAQPARVIAIGGVTPERVRHCIEAGAYGVAAVSALWEAANPAAVASRMLVCFDESSAERPARHE